jgi:cytochrome P450
LIAEPGKTGAAVEELLRTHAPTFGLARTAFADAEIGGQHIRNGERILLAYYSGNLDEQNFPNAKSFDLDRRRSPHLTFGRGMHFCLGSWLARLELEVAIRKILERMPNYSVDHGRSEYGEDVGLHNMWTKLQIIVNA